MQSCYICVSIALAACIHIHYWVSVAPLMHMHSFCSSFPACVSQWCVTDAHAFSIAPWTDPKNEHEHQCIGNALLIQMQPHKRSRITDPVLIRIISASLMQTRTHTMSHGLRIIFPNNTLIQTNKVIIWSTLEPKMYICIRIYIGTLYWMCGKRHLKLPNYYCPR